MKKRNVFLTIVVVLMFMLFALGSSEDTDTTTAKTGDKENASQVEVPAEKTEPQETTSPLLGDYRVEILGCRVAKDYEGKPIVIVKYLFTNVDDDDAASFSWSIDDNVYQNGIGLNSCYFVDDSANYSSDNQTKEIKKGASLEVEAAYELNDTTTDIEVEIQELISFSDESITKVFSITE